jgi:hypothetical protein
LGIPFFLFGIQIQRIISGNDFPKKYNIEMENNVFLNKDLFYTHQIKDFREQRLKDFDSIYQKLKDHIKPTKYVEFDEGKLKEYIQSYKKQNIDAIKELLLHIKTATFKDLSEELIRHAKSFKIEKYIYVIGATSDKGEDLTNFDLFKSNLWTFMIIYPHLPYKPYDIILNLSTGIRLYLNEIKDFLITDDASYSGEQLINNIIKPAATELTIFTKKENYKIVSAMFRPIEEKVCNLHLMIPYISNRSLDKLLIMELTSGFCFKRYNSFIIISLDGVMSLENYRIIQNLYNQYYPSIYFGGLIPFHFDYKIADMLSTVEIVLVKGKVLDDPKKQIVFLKSCTEAHDKTLLLKKIDCPLPPYKYYYSILKSTF